MSGRGRNGGGALTSAAAAAAQAYFSRSGIAGSLPRWQAALAAVRAGTRNAKLCILGDSTALGGYATGAAFGRNDMTLGWPYLLAPALQAAGYPVNLDTVLGDLTGTTVIANVVAHDARRSFGANWSAVSFISAGGQCVNNGTAGSQSVYSVTPYGPFDTIEITYVANTTYGKFSIAIDGAAPLGAVVDASGSLAVLKTTRTCALGNHRVDIYRSAATGADGSIAIISVKTYNSAQKCIEIINAAVGGNPGGMTASMSTDSAVYMPLAVLRNQVAPDLTIICLDINEWINAVTPGTYDLTTAATHSEQLRKIITSCQVSGDVILMTGAPSKISSYTRAVQDPILIATRNMASICNLPLVDVSQKWGDWVAAAALGYYLPQADAVHPGYIGYVDIAARVTAVPGILGVQ